MFELLHPDSHRELSNISLSNSITYHSMSIGYLHFCAITSALIQALSLCSG